MASKFVARQPRRLGQFSRLGSATQYPPNRGQRQGCLPVVVDILEDGADHEAAGSRGWIALRAAIDQG